MISGIKLKGFQKHKNLEVNFSPGLNVIVGNTDSGKSSIYRALRFALANQHKCTNIVNHDAKVAEVEVCIDTHVVNRKKGKSVNEYEVDGSLLRAFGTGIPDVVDVACNLTESNWSPQQGPEALFLIADTPGNVARRVNEMISLDLIDKSIKFVNAKKDKAKKDSERYDADILQLTEQINDYEWLVDARSRIEGIDAISKAIREEELQEIALKGAMQSLESADSKLLSMGFIDKAEEGMKWMLDRVSEEEKMDLTVYSLKGAIQKASVEVIDIPVEDMSREIQVLLSLHQSSADEAFDLMALERLIRDLSPCDVAEQEIDQDIKDISEELEKLQERCPTCNQYWNSEEAVK